MCRESHVQVQRIGLVGERPYSKQRGGRAGPSVVEKSGLAEKVAQGRAVMSRRGRRDLFSDVGERRKPAKE